MVPGPHEQAQSFVARLAQAVKERSCAAAVAVPPAGDEKYRGLDAIDTPTDRARSPVIVKAPVTDPLAEERLVDAKTPVDLAERQSPECVVPRAWGIFRILGKLRRRTVLVGVVKTAASTETLYAEVLVRPLISAEAPRHLQQPAQIADVVGTAGKRYIDEGIAWSDRDNHRLQRFGCVNRGHELIVAAIGVTTRANTAVTQRILRKPCDGCVSVLHVMYERFPFATGAIAATTVEREKEVAAHRVDLAKPFEQPRTVGRYLHDGRERRFASGNIEITDQFRAIDSVDDLIGPEIIA